MNDRLMIAAMAMQGMYTNERYNSISFADTANEALKQADALLAAAGEKEKPQEAGCACRWRNGEDKPYTRCGLHQGWFEVIAEWAERAKAAESKLAACERERDRSQSFAEGLQAELTEAIDARNAAEQSKERLAENLRKTRAAKFVCEQEAEAASIVIAALKRRLEPLTEDEARELANMTTGLNVSEAFFQATVNRADRIRSRRQP